MTPDAYRGALKRVETEYGEFAYFEAGDGPPAVFVHGLFMSGFMWNAVIDRVAADRRCIAYNLPHHGGSHVAADQTLDLEANVLMLGSFCDALDLGRLDLVANDTGGAIAQALAVRDPSRLRTLTLTNCEARDWMPSQHELGQLVKTLAQQGDLAPLLVASYEDIASARSGALAATFQWPERPSDDEVRALLEPHQATIGAARALERFAASLAPDQLVSIEPGLRALEVPTLAVWGTADPVFPLELALWLRDTIPGLREVVEIEGGRLFWPWERADELAPHLRRHWAAVAAAA